MGKHNRPHTAEEKQKNRERQIQHLLTHPGPFKDTKPELEFESYLQVQGIEYEHPKRIGSMLVDFYLPFRNLVIEIDGCYWHGCREHCPNSPWSDRWESRQLKLEALGYDSIRIWEHELEV